MNKGKDKRYNVEDISTINNIHEMNNNSKPLNFKNFISKEYKEQKLLLSPWLPEAGLAMVIAASGAGKTYFCLNVAMAIASGGVFLDYKASEKKRVLYIDGEMKASHLQSRMVNIAKEYPYFEEDNLQIITSDEMPNFTIPKLCSVAGQVWLDGLIEEYKIDLVIIDNISTLTLIHENDAHDWNIIQNWMIKTRSSGCGVLLVHHTGKDDASQRGSSKHIDVLDTAILLKNSLSILDNIPLNFKVSYEKARHFYGRDRLPFDAYMSKDGSWIIKDTNLSTMEAVVELTKLGMNQNEIAIELKIHRSNVSRAVKSAIERGLLPLTTKQK